MEYLESINPYSLETVGSVEVSTAEEIEEAVRKSRQAQKDWAALAIEERAELIIRASKEIKNRQSELAGLITKEMGKPLKNSGFEVAECFNNIEKRMEEFISALKDETIEDDRTRTTVLYSPLGVSAVITPWNFPVAMIDSMVVPSLIAGNTVILKPSEETPLTAKAWVDIFNEFLPKGVLQIVFGREDEGRELVRSDVDLIAFTGSSSAGKNIMKEAASKLKRIVFELGGKDPLVVLRDCDGDILDKAAGFAARYIFNNSGQMCVSTERVYVHAKVFDQFLELLKEKTKAFTTGNPIDKSTVLGPMVARWQKDHVISHIEDALSKGASIIYGPGDMSEHKDNFIEPLIITGVDHSMKIMTEETFGPVACLMKFNSVDEAVGLCNDTRFGLGGMIFGKDEAQAFEVACEIETAMIGVNRNCSGAKGSPWIGLKESGFSWRGGIHGVRNFTQLRHISTAK